MAPTFCLKSRVEHKSNDVVVAIILYIWGEGLEVLVAQFQTIQVKSVKLDVDCRIELFTVITASSFL